MVRSGPRAQVRCFATGNSILNTDSHADALIVGAGSAGAMLASRLSDDPSFRVVLVEAGPAPCGDLEAATRDGFVLPIGVDSQVVMRYPARLTATGERADLVRGQVVGGSAAVNGGYFIRGRPVDFDAWAVPGWSWRDVRRSFVQIETDRDFPADPLHGRNGPIPVRRSRIQSRAGTELMQLACSAGYRAIDDLNDESVSGVGLVPLNIEHGVRMGPARARLARVALRPNLTVHPHTRALRVLFDGDRAAGVMVCGSNSVGASVRFLTAERIVLSAGAIESAKLLLLSGIGPADQLRKVGVRPIVDLPGVGTRTMDHPEWLLDTGERGQPGRPVLDTVLHTDRDFGIEIRPYTMGFNEMIGHSSTRDNRRIGVALMTPRSRGTLRLSSANPSAAPRIDLSYDSAQQDIDRLREGVALVSELYGRRFEAPGWSTSQHLCATAPMGIESDEFAVVDQACRVRGVDGLFVVDGSIMPVAPSRGPAATVAMIGNHAARYVSAS